MSELITTQTTELSTVNAQTLAWELMQRKAKAYSQSSLVPVQYRSQIEKKEGYNTVMVENPSGVSNCIIAIDMAQRVKANELMVMQNLSIIQGRPSWSSQWIIAMINGCGRFSPLRFEVKDLGEKEVDYVEYIWQDKKQVPVAKKIKVHNFSCVAWATEKENDQKLESSMITIEMAVKEGWYTKNGSKWQTMPEVMLRYRAASFFGKIYAPELLMGLQSVEETQDIIDLSTKYPDAIVDNDTATDNSKRPESFASSKPKTKREKWEAENANSKDGISYEDEYQEEYDNLFDAEDVKINPEIAKAAEEKFSKDTLV